MELITTLSGILFFLVLIIGNYFIIFEDKREWRLAEMLCSTGLLFIWIDSVIFRGTDLVWSAGFVLFLGSSMAVFGLYEFSRTIKSQKSQAEN